VAVGVAIWVKTLQPGFWQRSSRSPVTPTLSAAAFHVRLICDGLVAVACRFPGAVGGCVSGGGAPPIGFAMSVWTCVCVRAEL
jgi:hypothetical protein